MPAGSQCENRTSWSCAKTLPRVCAACALATAVSLAFATFSSPGSGGLDLGPASRSRQDGECVQGRAGHAAQAQGIEHQGEVVTLARGKCLAELFQVEILDDVDAVVGDQDAVRREDGALLRIHLEGEL